MFCLLKPKLMARPGGSLRVFKHRSRKEMVKSNGTGIQLMSNGNQIHRKISSPEPPSQRYPGRTLPKLRNSTNFMIKLHRTTMAMSLTIIWRLFSEQEEKHWKTFVKETNGKREWWCKRENFTFTTIQKLEPSFACNCFLMKFQILNQKLKIFRPPKCSSKGVLWSIFHATADFSKDADCLAKATYEIHRTNCATQRVGYNSADDIFQMAQTKPQFMTFRHPMERLVSVWHGRFQQLDGSTVRPLLFKHKYFF